MKMRCNVLVQLSALLVIQLIQVRVPFHCNAFSAAALPSRLVHPSTISSTSMTLSSTPINQPSPIPSSDTDFSIEVNKDTSISTSTDTNATKQKRTSALSPAAQWHKKRRKEMISNTEYASKILPLEQESHGLYVGLPLLILSNIALASLSVLSSKLSIMQIIILAFFPGSMFSLWQLQISHDCLHGTLLPKKKIKNDTISTRTSTIHNVNDNIKNNNKLIKSITNIKNYVHNYIVQNRNKLHKLILFYGTMPSAFGYYLYLQYGHLTHHKSLGDERKSNLDALFNSNQKEFEDGDALFVAHRMKLKGEVGPKFTLPFALPSLPTMKKKNMNHNENDSNNKRNDDTTTTITMSISNTGFTLWKDNHPLRNALVFTTSFLFERVLLIWNDFVVACTGRNFFFPNKPKAFHDEVALYCRISVLVRLGLCYLAKSWKALFFLYLAETLWSIPPHPACAMFITNHGSDNSEHEEGCIPSSSTYAGKLYSLFTLGTNYHVEHHDFPTIPLHNLGKLQKIAPEYYRGGNPSINSNTPKRKRDNVFQIMKKTFSKAEFYACMDAGIKFD
jgi:fatty acid desaturase